MFIDENFKDFNPRFPRGKRQNLYSRHKIRIQFQSTLPAGEATEKLNNKTVKSKISIHASRGGSDTSANASGLPQRNFNPRFPRGKRLNPERIFKGTLSNFNPRFPRGKRPSTLGSPSPSFDFNPRFPRGKRHKTGRITRIAGEISIHASRGGSDT